MNFKTGEDTSILNNVCALMVEGRQYPVKVYYSIDPVPCYIKASLKTVFDIHEAKPPNGDILVFVTGQEEVFRLTGLIVDEYRSRKERHQLKMSKKNQQNYYPLRVLPFYGSLPPNQQMRVFEHSTRGCRKVVVATNLAETSLTIPGIVYVVDCGFSKIRAYNPETGLEALVTLPITKSSAQQRAGRAGRTRAGEVYRLYSEEYFKTQLADFNSPESMRSDLSYAIMRLKTLGVNTLSNFCWPLPAPSVDHLAKAAERLVALGLLEPMKGRLVQPKGLQMAELMSACGFSDPGAAVALLGAVEEGCTEEVATCLALMQIAHIFTQVRGHTRTMDRQRRKFFGCREGDHLTLLNAFHAFQGQLDVAGEGGRLEEWCTQMGLNHRGLQHATLLRERIRAVCGRMRIPWVSAEPRGNPDPILRAFSRGYFTHVARLSTSQSEYVTLRGEHILKLHPSSVFYATTDSLPPLILFTRVLVAGNSGENSHDVRTNPGLFEGGTCVTEVSVVRKEWLLELAPHYYRFGTDRQHIEYAMKNPAKY